MRSLLEFMSRRGTPIRSPPKIGRHPLNLVALYGHVMKACGCSSATGRNQWIHIATSLGINGDDSQALQTIYESYLLPYEEKWVETRRLLHEQASARAQRQGQSRQQEAKTLASKKRFMVPDASSIYEREEQIDGLREDSPVQAPSLPSQHHVLGTADICTDKSLMVEFAKSMNSGPLRALDYLEMENGASYSAQGLPRPEARDGGPDSNRYATRSTDAGLISGHSDDLETPDSPIDENAIQQTDVKKEAVLHYHGPYRPRKRVLDTHGGYDMLAMAKIGSELAALKPYPTFHDLGTVDIQAISLSIQSSLPAEMANALNILVMVAGDRRWGLPLTHCGDLLDALTDCMSTATDELMKHQNLEACGPAKPLTSYRDLVRYAKISTRRNRIGIEMGGTSFGSHLALERILAILTILRNLSFTDINQNVIASVNGFSILLSKIIRVFLVSSDASGASDVIDAGRRLDVAKDLITLLSHIAQAVKIENEQTADTITQFILSFAPRCQGNAQLSFTPYNQDTDPYTPPAIDALAKLFARDHPNRQYISAVLLRPPTSCNGGDRLTQALALGIAPLPNSTHSLHVKVCEARLPLLEHAMIICETLAEVVPIGGDIAKGWLQSIDGFSTNLVRLMCVLSSMGNRTLGKENPFHRLTRRGMHTLFTLRRKSKNVDGIGATLAKKEQILGAMLTVTMDSDIINLLCSLVDNEKGDIDEHAE